MSTPPTRRLFVAVTLPEPWQVAVDAWLATAPTLPEMRATAAAERHLTLQFLGNVAEADLVAVQGRLASALATEREFQLESDRVGYAPPDAPLQRMVWVFFQAHQQFSQLCERIGEAVWEFARPSDHPPLPHLTLARFRPTLPDTLPRLDPFIAPSGFPVRGCQLFQSTLTATGARHTILQEYQFVSL
jgi:2'-5' RNA ligase